MLNNRENGGMGKVIGIWIDSVVKIVEKRKWIEKILW